MANAPWASGPGEILQHAIQLLLPMTLIRIAALL